jgi:hypothetical protein
VTEQPPAELLRRLRPIPTYRDYPATTPCDIEGVTPQGDPCSLAIVESGEPVLLLFLSSHCAGCQDLWDGADELRRALPDGLRIVVVTRGPETEDASDIAAQAWPGTETVMSTRAFADYRVSGPPFLVVVAARMVRTEAVAWGIEETARAARVGLDQPPQ